MKENLNYCFSFYIIFIRIMSFSFFYNFMIFRVCWWIIVIWFRFSNFMFRFGFGMFKFFVKIFKIFSMGVKYEKFNYFNKLIFIFFYLIGFYYGNF